MSAFFAAPRPKYPHQYPHRLYALYAADSILRLCLDVLKYQGSTSSRAVDAPPSNLIATINWLSRKR